jgi:hypothetical protein
VPSITGAQEAVIVAGLKRPTGRATAASAQAGLDGGLPTLSWLGSTVASGVRERAGRMALWAAGRALAPNSLTGLSLLLALCAAAWFSGGTREDAVQGTLMLSGWLAGRAAARRLGQGSAAQGGGPPSGRSPARAFAGGRLPGGGLPGRAFAGGRSPASRLSGGGFAGGRLPGRRSSAGRLASHRAGNGSPDWLALPGAIWDEQQARRVQERRPDATAAHGRAAADAAWPAAICAVAAEYAIYGGIAAGGQSAGWTGMWPLATAAIIMVAIRDAIGSCGASRNRSRPESGAGSGSKAAIRRTARKVLVPSAGGRVALAVAALMVHGPRVAMFAILAVAVVSVCHTVAVFRPAGAGSAAGASCRQPAVRAMRCARATSAAPASQYVIPASRDDGAAARRAGRLVQGNLVPLPPALAGVAAVLLLAALGLGNLPGVLAFAPPAVMMLAAPGSGHPHDGRFDWLVPPVLQVGQYVYLAALGFASAVPGPVNFSLCAMTAIWYANRAADPAGTLAMPRRGRDEVRPPAAGGTAAGWEGRMFAVTLGALLGLATFAYLALAAYLGVLIGRKVVSGYLLPREDDRR